MINDLRMGLFYLLLGWIIPLVPKTETHVWKWLSSTSDLMDIEKES